MHINTRLRLMRDAGAVRRFHTCRIIKEDSVAEHSFNVANIVLALTRGRASRNLILAALFHDMGEYMMGDIPAPTKRLFPENVREAIEASEMEAICRIQYDVDFTISMEERAILKIADRMDGLMKCIDELRMGNRHIIPAGNNFATYMAQTETDDEFIIRAREAVISTWQMEINQ